LTAEDTVKKFGEDHEYTKLCINHEGIDPDDTFSTVPYEKGFHMIWYLDRLVGRENFDKFIPHYFSKFMNKSLDSYEFKSTFLDFFSTPEYASLKDKLAEIDWEGRFTNPGLPPKPTFDTSLIDVCYELADKWKSKVSSFRLLPYLSLRRPTSPDNGRTSRPTPKTSRAGLATRCSYSLAV